MVDTPPPLSPEDEKALDEILGLLVIAGDSATIQNVRNVKAALVTLLLQARKEEAERAWNSPRRETLERIAQIDAQIKGQK